MGFTFNGFYPRFLYCYAAVIARHVQISRRNGNKLDTLADVPGVDIIKSNRHLTVVIQIAKSKIHFRIFLFFYLAMDDVH